MFRIALIITLSLSGCAAPEESGNSMCECGFQSALQTSYDHESSTLGAENVQDAVDELATEASAMATLLESQDSRMAALEARPIAESAVSGRLELLAVESVNDGTALVSATANCPTTTDVPISGSCDAIPTGSLLGTAIVFNATQAAFQCVWSQPLGTTDALRVRVMCLHASE